MVLSDDPRSRRPLFLPVMLATIFLAIIGLSVGLALGSHHKPQPHAAQTQPVVPAVVAPSNPTPAWTGTGTAQPCRQETRKMAARAGADGSVTLVLLLRTKLSTVWICRDQAGRLYYHANRGGEDAEWIEGETALFLDDVNQVDNGYAVIASDGTKFSINAQRLEILHRDGSVETQPAAG